MERKRQQINAAKSSKYVRKNKKLKKFRYACELRRAREGQDSPVSLEEPISKHHGEKEECAEESKAIAAKAIDILEVPATENVELRGGEVSSLTKTVLSPSQVTCMFRSLGLPIRVFGEKTIMISEGVYNDSQRLERLKKSEESIRQALAVENNMDEFRLGSGHGIRNPFLGGKKDQEKEGKKADEAGLKKPSKEKIETDVDNDDPHKRIHRFFKSLLKQWEEELSTRSEVLKRTLAGKNETKTLKQCKDYIRPLFKLCKNRKLEPGLMGNILKIVECCEQGEFVRAHDAYMDVAIGRAAWPIGVTMVGIHARSGRAKIESSNVAHVMNSELQRKYLTSVKRLMSYYQKKRTDVNPSKKVIN